MRRDAGGTRLALRTIVVALLGLVVLSGCQTTGSSRSRSKNSGGGDSAAAVNVSLGQSYMRQGKFEIAKEKLDKALELDPKLTDAHTVIAVLYEQIGDPESAARHYKRASELAPKSGVVNNNYGTFLCKLGRYEEADRYYARALQDPFYETPSVALTNRGTCALKWQKPELAEQSFRNALSLKPDEPEALRSLAEILYGKGEYFRARAFVQRHDAGGRAGPEALVLAVRIEEALGDKRAARDYKDRLLRDFPESEQAQGLRTESEAKR